jgi:hypothetical protein
LFDSLDKVFRLSSQLIDDSFRVLEAALAFHVLQRITLHLFVCRFLFQNVDKDLIAGIGTDGVDDREGELALCEVFTEPFEGGVARCRGKVEVVVEDLEEETDRGY